MLIRVVFLLLFLVTNAGTLCLTRHFDNDIEMNTEDSANEIRPLFFNYGLLMRQHRSREGRGGGVMKTSIRQSEAQQKI